MRRWFSSSEVPWQGVVYLQYDTAASFTLARTMRLFAFHVFVNSFINKAFN